MKEKSMPDFLFDQEKHLIFPKNTSKFDALFSLLSEGILTSKTTKTGNTLLWSALRTIDEITSPFFRARLMKKFDVVPNRIVFGTFQGSYACNCKYIAEMILEKNLDYELIFLVDPDVYENREAYGFPKQIYLAKKNTAAAFFALATSKFWIDNALNCIWKSIPKKPEQIYLNTWHGSLGIKKLSGSKYWKLIASHGDRQIDAFLTNSTFDEKVFHSSFWPHVSHLKFGHPRNDLLFNKERMALVRKKIYNFYGIPETVNLALYAPTFRDVKSDISAIHLDFDNLIQALEKRFGGKWMVLSRVHYHNLDQNLTNLPASASIIDASRYLDMQELLAASDVGITDYSSWIFDFLFTGRPGFIYATDIEKYIHDRGFYYSLDKTPFSIAASDQQLAENIVAFDEPLYNRKICRFFKKMGCYESGTASEQIVRYIQEQ